MSDYLWDRSGPPDPEIERLEQLLAPLQMPARPAPYRPSMAWAAIAASLVLGAIVWQLFALGRNPQRTDWVVAENGRPLFSGELVRADRNAALAIESNGFGKVDLQPGSELRVLESSPGKQRLELQQGRLHALIWAPPAQFVVDTPSARTIDLGCQYDLSVDAQGNGFLQVRTGWVAFQAGQKESFIPAGAACRTTKSHGPGIPYFEDSSDEFRRALERVERHDGTALPLLLHAARQQDALSLWHLLGRVDREEGGAVFDRFSALVSLPANVSKEKALNHDQATLDACWNALGFSDVTWWREWKRNWR